MTVEMCSALDPDCEACSRRAKGRDHGRCDDLCRLIGDMIATEEGHAAFHAAERCRRCGVAKYDDDGRPVDDRRRCPAGRCTEYRCVACGDLFAADGPVNCPCIRVRAAEDVRRCALHAAYRRRRRR